MPILYFAVFDFEYEKEEFERDHRHYRIGFKSKYHSLLFDNLDIDTLFSKAVFWNWVFYGMW